MNIEEEILNMSEFAWPTEEQKENKEFFLVCIKLGKLNYALQCKKFITKDFLENYSKEVIDFAKTSFPVSLSDSRVFRDFLIEKKEYDLLINFSYSLINEIDDENIINQIEKLSDLEIKSGNLKTDYSKYKAMSMGRVDLFGGHTRLPYDYEFYDRFYELIVANIDKFEYLKYGNSYLGQKCMEMGNFDLAEKMGVTSSFLQEKLPIIIREYWDKVIEYNEKGISELFANSTDLFNYYLENGNYDKVVQFGNELLTKEFIDSHEKEIISSLGSKIPSNSMYNSSLFVLCLKNKRYDLCAQFNIDWPIELIKSYGKDILAHMEHIPYRLQKNNDLFNYVIEIGRYDLIVEFDSSLMTDEIIDKYADVIVSNMQDVPYYFSSNPTILKSVIKNKKYDLMNKFYDSAFSDGVISSDEFIDYLKVAKDIPFSLRNPKVFEKILLAKRFDLINTFANIPGTITEEIIEKYGPDLVKGLKSIPFEFYNNPNLLRQVILAKRYDLISNYSFSSDLFTGEILKEYLDIVPEGSKLDYKILENEDSIRIILDKKRYDLLVANSYNGSFYYKFSDSIYKDYADILLTKMPFLSPMEKSNTLLHYAFEHNMMDKIPLFSIRAYDDELISKYGASILSLLQEKVKESHVSHFNMTIPNIFKSKDSESLKYKSLLVLFLENDLLDNLNKFDSSLFDNEIIDKYYEKIMTNINKTPFHIMNNSYLLNKVLENLDFDYIAYFDDDVFTPEIIEKNFNNLVEYYTDKQKIDYNIACSPYFLEKVIQINREDLFAKFNYKAFTDDIVEKYYLYIENYVKRNNVEVPANMHTFKLFIKFINNGLDEYAKKMCRMHLSKTDIENNYDVLLKLVRSDYKSPFAEDIYCNPIFFKLFMNDCNIEEIQYVNMGMFTYHDADVEKYYPKLFQWIIEFNNGQVPVELVSDANIKKYCLNNGYNELYLHFTMGTAKSFDDVKVEEIINEYAPLLNIDPLELRKKIDFLLHRNDEILNTLLPLMLSDRMSILSTKHLLTICLYPDLQYEIINLNNQELLIIDKIFDYTDSVEFDTCSVLYNVLNNFKYYKKLVNEIDNMNDEQLTNLIYIMQRKNNIFGINTISDLTNENLTEKMLYKFNSFDINIDSKNNIDYVKDMLLLKKYGIDLEESKFICQRYCMDKSIVLKSGLDDNLKILLEDIYDIIYSNDIDELKFMYTTSDLVLPDFRSMLFLEAYIRSEYVKLYNNTLYHIKDDDLLQNNEQLISNKEALEKMRGISYNGTKPKIYLLSDDFNLQIHALGAYSGYERPDDFLEDWNRPKMASHGICTSYIGNNQIANARAYHPILGFDVMEESDLLLSANYDIGSSLANLSYATSREIVANFLPPDENINYTRHTHNEMVVERMKYINDKACKKMPSYVVYLVDDVNNKYNYMTKNELIEEFKINGNKEDLIDKIMNESDTYFLQDLLEKKEISKEDAKKISCVFYYEEVVQAAIDINIPIVIVDRLQYAKREKAKCDTYYNKLVETNDCSYISPLLLTYFNNMIGCIDYAGYDSDYCKYFNDSDFDLLYNNIIKSIDDIENIDNKLNHYYVLEKELNIEEYKRQTFKGGAPSQLKPLTTYQSVVRKKIEESKLLMEDVSHGKNI